MATELDFRNEYHNLRTAGAALRHTTRGAVAAPIPISATQACLVTELLEGYTTLAALTRRAEGHGSVVDGGGSSHSAPSTNSSHGAQCAAAATRSAKP